MADTAILVINGKTVLDVLDRRYQRDMAEWGSQCLSVRARFKKKTSRKLVNGKAYESTNWYEEQPIGRLKSVGKEEPDYSKYYPPEPKPAYSFKFQEYEGHILIEEKDYNANRKLFEDCLAFRLEECRNFGHPLYKNPQKVIDSVREHGVSSARSQGGSGQKRDPAQIEDGCFNDGDCDNCEHNDECPVIAEADEDEE